MNNNGGISKVVSAELATQRRRRSFFALPAVLVALAAVVYLGVDAGARNNWFGIPSGFFVAASTIGWMANVFALVVVVMTSFLVSQEFALGTVKSAWVRPLGRQAWFAGKVLYAGAAVTALYLAVVVVVVVLAALRPGYADLMEKDYLIHTAGAMAARMVVVTVLTLFAIWTTVVVTAAFAALFDHPGAAIAVLIGFGVAMTALTVFPPVRPYLLTTYLGAPSEQMVAMSKGLPLPFEWKDLVWRTLATGVVWAVVSYVAGGRIISRKDITG